MKHMKETGRISCYLGMEARPYEITSLKIDHLELKMKYGKREFFNLNQKQSLGLLFLLMNMINDGERRVRRFVWIINIHTYLIFYNLYKD